MTTSIIAFIVLVVGYILGLTAAHAIGCGDHPPAFARYVVRFCKKCGKELKTKKLLSGYNESDGRRIVRVEGTCPDYRHSDWETPSHSHDEHIRTEYEEKLGAEG